MILTQGWYSDVPMGDLGPTRQKVGGIAIWRLGQQGNGPVDYVGARTFMPQADLVQAGKLAALGQISAALSDAINQPVAAMRNHATMSRALIDRGAGTGIYRTGPGFSQVQREGVRDRVRGADPDHRPCQGVSGRQCPAIFDHSPDRRFSPRDGQPLSTAIKWPGKAGTALAVAALGSFFAGTVATILVAVLAPPLTVIALKFGAAQYFSLMLLGLVSTIALVHGSIPNALAMILARGNPTVFLAVPVNLLLLSPQLRRKRDEVFVEGD